MMRFTNVKGSVVGRANGFNAITDIGLDKASPYLPHLKFETAVLRFKGS